MRVDPRPLDTIATALEQTTQQQNTLLQELSTGSSINAPSDNPVGAAQVLQDTFQKSADTQFGNNVANLQGQMQVASSALSSVATALTQAIQLGTEGANGTMSDTDRQAVAQEVSGIQSQLMGLANTQYQGSYLFGGTATTTPPYSADSNGVVSYGGNNGVNTAEISSGQFTPTNLPGSKLFAGSGTDMFKAMNDLATALQSGTGIADATTEVQNSFNSVNTQTTFYGNTLSRLNSTSQFLSSEEVQLTSNVSTVSGADLAKVSAELVQASTATQALTGAAYQVNQLGLISILT
jgi:flagellar hook-associated protein 3 FlgL